MSRSALVLSLIACGLFVSGCSKKQAATSVGVLPAVRPDQARAFGEAAPNLMKALTEPTEALHFSYKAQAQINPKFPHEAGSKPELGPVAMEADVSPDVVNLEATRGAKTEKQTAKKEDALAWSMVKLPLMGPLMNVSMLLAFAAPAARSADGITWTFDSRTMGAAERSGMAMAQSLLRGKVKVDQIYGTLSVDPTTGRLATFNLDAEMKDEAGNAWKEHHEGKGFKK